MITIVWRSVLYNGTDNINLMFPMKYYRIHATRKKSHAISLIYIELDRTVMIIIFANIR